MQVRAWVWGMSALLTLNACGATNTGNPAEAPEGVKLVRSSLERETTTALDAGVEQTFGDDSRDFAFDLYQRVISSNDNAFFSPYSIRLAMAMTYAGANGQTKQEMKGALHFSQSDAELHAAFNDSDLSLMSGARNAGDVELSLVNAAFLRKDAKFKQSYLDLLAVNYGAGMYLADFAAQAEHERMVINDWVAEKTHDRIIDLLPPSSLDSSTVFVLVNSIYFKGKWATEFSPNGTSDGTFHRLMGDVTVPMMYGSADNFFQGDGYQSLELPYVAPSLRMLFILPDQGRFAEIEAQLDRALFDEARSNLAETEVGLQVPKFRFSTPVELRTSLQALGVVQLFDAGTCDLSAMMATPGDVYVDQVYHQAFISVDEAGTEAAAATAVVATRKAVLSSFTIDRPFIFAIYDEPTGQILFLGRVMDPSKG